MIITERPAPDVPPKGHRYVARHAPRWRIQVGDRCRRRLPGVQQRTCGNLSVAALDRGHQPPGRERRESWWAYCPEHMYGKWIEHGQVWQWVLVKIGGGDE